MHRILKDDREYERVNGQWRRVKIPPLPQKHCKVFCLGKSCWYDERQKILFVCQDGRETVFPSKSMAQKAIWHTTQNSVTSHLDYEIEVVR